MHARNVLDQYAAPFQTGKYAICVRHPQQDEVRGRIEGRDTGHGAQCSQKARPFTADTRGLLIQLRQVIQQQIDRGQRQDVDVVRWPHLVELGDPGWVRAEVAKPKTCQPKLGQGAQDQHVRMRRQRRQPWCTKKGTITKRKKKPTKEKIKILKKENAKKTSTKKTN